MCFLFDRHLSHNVETDQSHRHLQTSEISGRISAHLYTDGIFFLSVLAVDGECVLKEEMINDVETYIASLKAHLYFLDFVIEYASVGH